VFDDTAKAIRVIAGVPGAASLGEAVGSPVALTEAFVHSGARVAVVSTKTGSLALLAWSGAPRLTVLETALGPVKQAAFSRSGRRVVITDGAKVEVWSTGAAPALVSRHDRADVTKIAVNDEGVVVATTANGNLLRYAADTTDDAQSIGNGGDWTALAFSSDGSTIIAVDAASGELVRITSEGGRVLIAVLPETVGSVAVSADGEQFAATLSSSLLLISAAGSVTPVACNCEPKGLDSLLGGLVVQVRGTAKILDAEGGEPRITFLPNLLAVNAGGNN